MHLQLLGIGDFTSAFVRVLQWHRKSGEAHEGHQEKLYGGDLYCG